MPAVVVDTSVLISLAAGELFHLLHDLLRAKAEGKIQALRPVLDLLKQRTSFWLSEAVYQAALAHAREAP